MPRGAMRTGHVRRRTDAAGMDVVAILLLVAVFGSLLGLVELLHRV
jgi:hypothetical protein